MMTMSVRDGASAVRFGAQATPDQVREIRGLVSRLSLGGPVDDELCFRQSVRSMSDVSRVTEEVKRDGLTLLKILQTRAAQGQLTAQGQPTVDVHYLLQFSSKWVARLGEAAIHKMMGRHQGQLAVLPPHHKAVKRQGANVLVHVQMDTDTVKTHLPSLEPSA